MGYYVHVPDEVLAYIAAHPLLTPDGKRAAEYLLHATLSNSADHFRAQADRRRPGSIFFADVLFQDRPGEVWSIDIHASDAHAAAGVIQVAYIDIVRDA